MEVRTNRLGYTRAAGSYIQLFVAAAIMVVPFSLVLVSVFIRGDPLIDAHSEERLLLTGGILMGMGWMMAIGLGSAFDLLPMVHKVLPFDERMTRMVVATNVIGQALICGGILLNSPYWFGQLGLMGVTLLAAQLWMLLPPAWETIRTALKERVDDEVGVWSYLPTLFLPLMGTLVPLAWLMPENRLVYELGWYVMVDLFWVTVCFTAIISHFNRRLGWEIIDPKDTRRAFNLFLVAQAIHLVVLVGESTGHISDHRWSGTAVLPVLVLWLLLKPHVILRRCFQRDHCSVFVATGHTLLLIAALIAIVEILFIERDTGLMHFRYFILLAVTSQILFGLGHWLHEDHKHTPIDRRPEGWLHYVPMNFSIGVFIYAVMVDAMGFPAEYVEATELIIPFGFLLSGLLAFVWWVREFHLGLYDWRRIPMFWGELHEDLDPYVFENGEE